MSFPPVVSESRPLPACSLLGAPLDIKGGGQGSHAGSMETGAQALALGVSRGGCWAIKADSGQVMGTVEGSDSSDVLAKYLCSHFLLACSSRPGSAIDDRRRAPALASTLGSAWPWASPSALGLSPKPCWPQEVQVCKGSQGCLLRLILCTELRWLLPVCPDVRVGGGSPCVAGLGPDVRSFPI